MLDPVVRSTPRLRPTDMPQEIRRRGITFEQGDCALPGQNDA